VTKNVAIFTPDHKYRYYLSWPVDDGSGMSPLFKEKRREKVVAWLLLNPSIADAIKLDPTLTRCMGFTKAWGGTRMDVVNIYALVSTDPDGLRGVIDPIGIKNDRYILDTVKKADIVVVGWGSCAFAIERARQVKKMLRKYPLQCLGTNSDGSPKHPLYLRSSTKLIPFPIGD
jgi:hypothetical protein